MTTTLNKIKEHTLRKEGWEKLLKTLGKTKADDEELDLLTILNSNGVPDTVWCFRAVKGYAIEIQAFTQFCRRYDLATLKPYASEDDYNLVAEWFKTGNEYLRIYAELAIDMASQDAVWATANSSEEAEAIAEAMVALKRKVQETELRRILKV